MIMCLFFIEEMPVWILSIIALIEDYYLVTLQLNNYLLNQQQKTKVTKEALQLLLTHLQALDLVLISLLYSFQMHMI